LKEKALKIASYKLETDIDNLAFVNGSIQRKDDSNIALSLKKLAYEARAMPPGTTFAYPVEPGLEVTEFNAPKAAAVSSMADLAVVEVDPNSCMIKILNYTSIHDNGRLLNPLVVNGQMMGGIANGIGNALYEEIVYDNDGQLLNGSLMDYLVPSSFEIPDMTLGHIETLSPLNPLGIKGAGESGTIPVLAVIQSAVEDALRDWNIKLENIPVKPSYIRELIKGKILKS
jgi:carbon-monoxide dehydrogenase large subunit